MEPALQLLTIKQVASRLNVSIRTVRRLATEGKLKPWTLTGNVKRYFPRDVDTYLERLGRGDFEGVG